MQWVQLNRDRAERAYQVIFNAQAAALDLGDSVVWDVGTVDGIRTTQPVTATLSLFVGVALEAVPSSDYGRVQSYGLCTQAFITNTTNQAIAAGDILIPTNAADYLSRSGASDGKSGFVFAAEAFATATTPAAAKKKVFIRAL